MPKIIFIFITLSTITLGCQNTDEISSIYSYNEMIEIYAVTQFFSNGREIDQILSSKYSLDSVESQQKYHRSFSQFKTKEKWHPFVKDVINYYINLKKKQTVRYYQIEGHEERINRFNDNHLIDPKSLPDSYWRVTFLSNRLPYQVVMIKELFEKGKPKKNFFYDEYHRNIIKEESYLTGDKKAIYYISSVPID